MSLHLGGRARCHLAVARWPGGPVYKTSAFLAFSVARSIKPMLVVTFSVPRFIKPVFFSTFAVARSTKPLFLLTVFGGPAYKANACLNAFVGSGVIKPMLF